MRIDYTNGYYEGEVNSKEEHHGRGKFVYNSGDKYIGEYRNNKMCGRGTYYFSDGTIYEGEWLDNKKHGHGKMTYPDGGYYEGEWDNDHRHGYGKEVNSTGQYEGHFQFDECRGQGKLTLNSKEIIEGNFYTHKNASNATLTRNGQKYKGKYVDNKFIEDSLNGYQEIRCANGIYKGNFKDNKRHGIGTYVWDDGCVYTGNWQEDERTGFGKLETPESTYEGYFKDGIYDSVGTLILSDGRKYTGYWVDTLNAYRVIATIDNEEYIGVIINGEFIKEEDLLVTKKIGYSNAYYEGQTLFDKRHGYGTCVWQNGAKYEGEWVDDLMQGKGKFYFPDGVVYDGTFEKGKKLYGKEIYGWGYYEGEYKDNKWYGNGKVINNDGSYFTGTFEDSKNVIDVTYVDANGEISYGKIMDNEFIEEEI